MHSLMQLAGSFFRKRPSPLHAERVTGRPVAYVDCGRGITFEGDFIVGMTLYELLEWLQRNCSWRPVEGDKVAWLPDRLRLADPDEVPMDYVIREGDTICLADPTLPAPEKRLLIEQL